MIIQNKNTTESQLMRPSGTKLGYKSRILAVPNDEFLLQIIGNQLILVKSKLIFKLKIIALIQLVKQVTITSLSC